MSEGIVIAIIGAAGAVIVAIINKFVGRNGPAGKDVDSRKTAINQISEGNGTTQIGVQINHEGDKDD